jgi:hypothetical protein
MRLNCAYRQFLAKSSGGFVSKHASCLPVLIQIIGELLTSPAVFATDEKDSGRQAWDFEDVVAGKSVNGFKTAVGEWSIAADGKNHVLAQTAQNPDSVFNLILRADVMYADVDLSVRLKAVAGEPGATPVKLPESRS